VSASSTTLERLLQIAKAARSADSIKALDDLQAEIDTIQGDMIHEVEAGTLDETAMMAYAMSVERAQLTISDRRPSGARPAAAAPRSGCVAVIHRYIAAQQHPIRHQRGPL
jgi:hypothetical protein